MRDRRSGIRDRQGGLDGGEEQSRGHAERTAPNRGHGSGECGLGGDAPTGGHLPAEGVVLLAAIEDALRQDEKLHEYEDAIESARKSVIKIEELLQPGAVTPALVKAREA